MTKVMGNCRLCLNHAQLCDSHIIPDFIYEPLFGEDHKIALVSSDANDYVKQPSSGAYDQLLCQSCETKLSQFETEAKKLWPGGKNLTAQIVGVEGDQKLYMVSGLDYAKLKLFQLSVLWRASITKHELFKLVRLGPHEEKLRTMILNSTPGKPSDYGCLMYAYVKNGHLVNKILSSAVIGRTGETKVPCYTYDFVFGGLHWHYTVATDDKIMEPLHRMAVLQENGDLHILETPFDDSNVDKALRHLANVHKQRVSQKR